MSFLTRSSSANENAAKLAALDTVQGMIEFAPDGRILTANKLFLQLTGYTLPEIQGQHHSLFVDSDYGNSLAYKEFWAKLGRGEHHAGRFMRLDKNGQEVWIEASYNPIKDRRGKMIKVVKYAIDVTRQTKESADLKGQVAAINKSQAVIEFALDGTILTANQNFLDVTGYTLAEFEGMHHSMFVDPAYRNSLEYQRFWADLKRCEFQSAQFRRLGKGGKQVWIEASYNPIFDPAGRPFKVVKFATDITQQRATDADIKSQMTAIEKSQAIIEFALDGTVLTANQNFLDTLGYTLKEVVGHHHRMFVDSDTATSPEYAAFWNKLRAGQFEARVYRRVRKSGSTIWIQASYNPVFDTEGKLIKVVKFAQDLTGLMEAADLADEAMGQVQNVAAATEQMSASVQEISRNMALSKQATDDIATKTSASGDASRKLANRMGSMSTVVDLIRSIAGQVKLLSLNATIEAARAGDAGKGFGVVASEVKNLANQTETATSEIEKEILSVQELCTDVARSIEDIVAASSRVSEYVTGAAGAVEQQNAATGEIASNSQRASTATAEISARIRDLAAAESPIALTGTVRA